MTFYRNRTKFYNRQKGNVFLPLAIFAALIFLSAFYLAQVNELVAKNFQLRASQDLLQEKEDQNQKVMVSLMEMQSLKNLENAASGLQLVSVEKVNYLKTQNGSLAISKNTP